jgi:(p)ppGpp synthase/HD superfamily hydrolase
MSRLRNIEANFDPEVGRIVEGCSDSFAEKKPWEEGKRGYIERLKTEPEDTLLVSAAGKLYNVRAIVEDIRQSGLQEPRSRGLGAVQSGTGSAALVLR